MRREFVLGAVVAAAMAVGVGAQSTPPSSSQTTPPSQSPSYSQTAGEKVTFTGCLVSADQWKGGTAGTSGTTGATGAPGSTSASRSSGATGFVLTDASMGAGAASPSSPAGTSGTGASSSADKDALMLKGKDDDLQKHVGHRVEVEGTLAKSSSGADPSMTTPPSTAGTAGSTASVKGTLTVTSVKEISGSCSGGGNR